MEFSDAHDFDELSMINCSKKKFSLRKEMCVPHVETVVISRGPETLPSIGDLVNMRERFYTSSGANMSEQVLHHILHPEEDDDEVDEEHRHIVLDLGTQTLQRIIDQMKTLLKVPASEPSRDEAYNAGVPRYCEFIQGEKCHAPRVQTLEQILGGS
jgi:hypothetical protein